MPIFECRGLCKRFGNVQALDNVDLRVEPFLRLVDEEALIRALRRGEIGGACLDVFEDEPLAVDHPLRDLRNVILTPHTAGYPDGPRYHRKRYAFFAENIEKVMRDETPEGCLNHVGGR